MGESRICESCGARFNVSDRELQQCRMPQPGMHHPSQCPEGLDTMCPNCDATTCGPTECKSCRPKQDMMGS